MREKYLYIFILWILVSCHSIKKRYSDSISVVLKQRPDVVDIKPSLEQCLKNPPYCSMIFSPKIRTENPDLKEGYYYTNYLYAAITSCLEKNNIVVDGRKLNSALYDSDKLITDDSYAPKKLIDDLLIEFVGFEALKYYANKTDVNRDISRKEIKLLKKQCFIGQKLEFKIIHVLTGETVGHFIYYYTPCTSGCGLSTIKSNNTGQLNKKTGTTINVDEAYKIFEPLLQRFTGDLLKYKNDSVAKVPLVINYVQSHTIALMYHPDNSSITFESGTGLTYNLTITNYLGEKIIDAPVTDKQLLNLNHLAPDTYFLEIKFNSIVVKNEIIKVMGR